jgi:hypothetical protein
MTRTHDGKSYRVILGKLKGRSGRGDPMVEQTYRYAADVWTEDEAMAHCRAHSGALFEPATSRGRREGTGGR